MIIVKPDSSGINHAVKILRAGGVIVYPTDTAYALGGIFNSTKVINKILKIKNRRDKKFTLIAANSHQVQCFFKLNLAQKKLAKKYWPGPLSIVISFRQAVRVPKNSICQKLCQKIGYPLIATSANVSGTKTPYVASQIQQEFAGRKYQPDLIINAGKIKKIPPSTVVKVQKNKLIILRSGSIKPGI